MCQNGHGIFFVLENIFQLKVIIALQFNSCIYDISLLAKESFLVLQISKFSCRKLMYPPSTLPYYATSR